MTDRPASAADPTGTGRPGADWANRRRPAEVSSMPLEFAAFCELHRPRYLSYARVWFRDPCQAAAVVQQALDELAEIWREVLGSPNPAAAAWQILRDTVAEAAAEQAPCTPHTTRVEPRRAPVDEDLAILHYVVGLATREIADVVGADTASITSQLRHALRRETADW